MKYLGTRTPLIRRLLNPVISLFFLIGFVSLQSFALAAATHVPTDQPTIQDAIDAASRGELIVVAPGTYQESIDFLGKAITLRSSDGPSVTIIDGSGSHGSIVQCVSGEGPDTVLEGFTITGGHAEFGGGMHNNGSSPTLIDCIFTLNAADDRGGGMYNREGNATVIGTTFLKNTAVAMGGGMFNIRASPVITDCRFTENSSNKGGGMRNYINSHPTVTDTIFDSNHAGEEGGGMDNRKNSNPVVTRCTFIGNTAPAGAAMHNYIGRAAKTGNPIIRSSLFTGNVGFDGSAIRNNDSSPDIINSTIAFNLGAAAISSRNGSAPNLLNCIVWGHPEGAFAGKTAIDTTVNYSNIQGGWDGVGNLDFDPLFVSVANDDYHLTSISPSVDAGIYDLLLPTTDLDGQPRIMGGTVDMGAYELGICSAADEIDADLDGYSVCGGDCNDGDDTVNPAATEICGDAVDNNCNGSVDEGCGTPNASPTAAFAHTTTALTADFTDTSFDPDGAIVSWFWNFGDGNDATTQNPNHSYTSAGTFNVELTVTDDDGASHSTIQPVTVGNLTVSGILPNTTHMPNVFDATITGTGFTAGAQITFSNASGPAPQVTGSPIVEPTKITLTITVKAGGPPRPRKWDMTVTSSGSSTTVNGALTVEP